MVGAARLNRTAFGIFLSNIESSQRSTTAKYRKHLLIDDRIVRREVVRLAKYMSWRDGLEEPVR